MITNSHRVAIEVRYLGPTDHRGARLKASAGKGRPTVTISAQCEGVIEDRAAEAAQALCDRMQWEGDMIGGDTGKAWVFVFVPRA